MPKFAILSSVKQNERQFEPHMKYASVHIRTYKANSELILLNIHNFSYKYRASR